MRSKVLDKNNVLTVDFLNLSFRYKHQKIRDFGEHISSTIASLANSYNCGTILVLADKKGSDYRKAIHPGYKGARKELYANQSEKEKEEAQQFFDDYEEAIGVVAAHYPVARYQGVEADDLAAAAVCEAKYDHMWLISSDKDWDLLVNPMVSRFSYVTRKEVTFDNWEEHYDVPIEHYITYKCLMGDTGDSVEGIEGVGPKRAQALVAQYGDLETIIANIPLPGKYKYIQAVNKSKDLLERNVKLMDLIKHHKDAIGKYYTEYMELINGLRG
jgi:5'-3' exonuclease